MLDLRDESLKLRIEALRTGFAGHQAAVRTRNEAFLRAYSPPFDSDLKEFDQWPDRPTIKDDGHSRSSYNLTRSVVELWSSLEMSEFPAIRWFEPYFPTPVPALDEMENAKRQEIYRAQKLVGRQVATMREQTLMNHVRRSKLPRHMFRSTTKKNIYGHSWIKSVPDPDRRTFRVFTAIDPSTVFPVYSAADDSKLDAVLVAYRRSAQSVNAQFPGFLKLSRDGLTADDSGYYDATAGANSEIDRRYVWVEDYWALDSEYTADVSDDYPLESRVVNCIRVNGQVAPSGVTVYPGWRTLPYFRQSNDDERDSLGFSDAGTMLPIQDGLNKFMSQQQDVIGGEARPKFKFRGDSNAQITFGEDEITMLDRDEDIEQIAVRLDVFPTQIHGQQLMDVLSRATGLPDVVWGRINASQNSGRALATAWRSVAARMIPRIGSASDTIEALLTAWVDWMELYDWDNASELYQGNRDFELDFPNQEPRDFQEVTLDAINKLGAGIIDLQQAMEDTGERSPDEMIERVRADYVDTVLHPEKGQSYLLLTRLKNQIAIEAQQAGIQAATAEAQLAQLAASPPGGAPGGGTPDQQAGAAAQARTQAAQQAAPQLGQGQGAPAGGPQRKTVVSTLAQDGGAAQNRIIDTATFSGG